jgi:RNA polymerase sigma factor (sigma-70 family)
MSELEELVLIQLFLAARRGSPTAEQVTAWEGFFQNHESCVWNVIKDCTAIRGDDEDLFQEVWRVLVLKLPKLQYDPNRGPLRAWVIVVARRAARREARRLSRMRVDALTPELAEVLLDPGIDPITRCEQEQERQWVRSILETLGATLSESSHRITVLHWIDGQSMPEIASATGLSEDRVRMRLQRALKKLRGLASAGAIQTNEK